MTIEDICTIRDNIEKLVDAHPEELKDLFYMEDSSTIGSEDIRKEYEDMMAPGRQLHIGIVGRVKAGKSSLLNSLFFDGKDILPKAATPMTAALTKLKYSEKPVLKVNFFETRDLDKFKENAKRYKEQFERKTSELLDKKRELAEKKKEPFNESEVRKRCESLARTELSDNIILAGAAEQQEMIERSGSDILKYIGKSIEKEISNIEDLGKELHEYVGADGKLTPITRDVELGFPFEGLKDITVVDTPGFDDPVPSRDAAARHSLKKCDVIFIISPAGQFCNQEDKNNIEKIEKGEGIQHIFVVASKIDAELGNESKDEANGNLIKEIQIIVSQIEQTLRKLIRDMPGGPVREKLQTDLESGLLYTSGACQSMFETWDDSSRWNHDLCDVWERLQSNYPDLFGSFDESSRELIKQIGNTEALRKKIAEVRDQKDSILNQRKTEFLEQKNSLLKNLVGNMAENFSIQKKDFEQLDMQKLKTEQKQLSEIYTTLKQRFEEMLIETFEEYFFDCKELSHAIINEYYRGTIEESKQAQGIGSERRTGTRKVDYEVLVKDPGFFAMIKRLGGGGYHTETRQRDESYEYDESFTYVNATEVREALSFFALDLKDELSTRLDKKRRLLRSKLKHNILEIWAEYDMNEFCGSGMRDVQASQIISVIPDCTLDIQWSLPKHLECKGRLRNSEAEDFMDEARTELRRVKSTYSQSVEEFLHEVKTKLDGTSTAALIMKKMESDLEKQAKAMEHREATLDCYRRIEKELAEFSKSLN